MAWEYLLGPFNMAEVPQWFNLGPGSCVAMRGHTAQMPSSVKCFTRTGKSHAFYDPTLTLPTDFAVSAFPFNPYAGGAHLSPTSQLILSQHSLFVCWYLLYSSVKSFLILLSPSCFQLSSSLWHRCLLSQCTCVLPFRYQRHSSFRFFTTFCCGLL